MYVFRVREIPMAPGRYCFTRINILVSLRVLSAKEQAPSPGAAKALRPGWSGRPIPPHLPSVFTGTAPLKGSERCELHSPCPTRAPVLSPPGLSGSTSEAQKTYCVHVGQLLCHEIF